jgi:nitroreductase
MSSPLKALNNAPALDRETYRPEIYRLTEASDRERLEALLRTEPRVIIHDELHGQLTEFIRTQNPTRRSTKEELERAVAAHLGTTAPEHYGVWVYYPWNFRLVHLLDEAEFFSVRTDRNRNKITTAEQRRLATKKVGVIGLSVGQSVSMAMAQERSFGEIRLADFDTLELSNLNRIRSGVHEMGVPKVVNTARAIAELDPFLRVRCYPEGITPDNIDAFLTDGGTLDVLVEECDSVDVKIYARQKAKALGIPVVMDMSDRGCLDIERFDLEPERPIMHGWIDHLDLDAASKPMSAEEKVPFMLPISGVETLSPRMKASVMELGQTLGSWPQLATSVVLGGALAGDAVRRIALGQLSASGRWFIDLDELIADATEQVPPTAPDPPPFEITEEDLAAIHSSLAPVPKTAISLKKDQLTQILEAGALAPSAGNVQPWKFAWRADRLLVFHDTDRSASFWDPDHFIGHITMGTCIENIVQGATTLGLEAKVDLAPLADHPHLMASIVFEPGGSSVGLPASAQLGHMIGMRCTNRKMAAHVPFPSEVGEKLTQAVEQIDGCAVKMLMNIDELKELSEICGIADRVRAMNPIGHREFFEHEVRWTREEAERTRDGLDIGTLEMGPVQLAGFKMAADPRAMALVHAWNGGHGLEQMARYSIPGSSVVALVCAANDSVQDHLRGGRAIERLWLTANAEGWAVHPISAPIFLTHALHSPMDGLSDRERSELASMQARFDRIWNITTECPLFMVRLSRAGDPSVRSLRLPIQQLLIQETHQIA